MSEEICCLIIDDEPTAREIIATHLAKIQRIKIEGSCANVSDAFNIINTHQIHLIFLDINMPEISGLSFARSINRDIKIIFTTAYREYALDGFDLQAVDYLLKPISFERLFRAVNLFQTIYFRNTDERLPEKNEVDNSFMFVKSDRKMVRINFADIQYLESLSDYLKIHTHTGTILIRETISNIEKQLPDGIFIRIHRSFIIALASIVSYTYEHVEINGKTIPISRGYRSEVLEHLEKWSVR